MPQSFSRLVRKYTLLQSIVPLLFFLLTIYLLFFSNFKSSFSPLEIQSLSETRQLFFNKTDNILLHDVTLYYTGYDYQENDKVCGSFYYTFEDDSCYFFLLKTTDSPDRTDTLTLSTLHGKIIQDEASYHELTSRLASDLAWSVDDVEEIAPDILISSFHADDRYTTAAFLLLCTCIAIASLSLIYYGILFAFPYYQFKTGPACTYSSLRNMAQNCEQQLLQEPFFQADTICITKTFFCSVNDYFPAVIPTDNIMWIYKHSTFHRLTVMPAKLTYTIHIMTKEGKHYHFKGFSKEITSSILQYMDEQYPDILIGYSEKKQNLVHHHLHLYKES